MSGRAMLDGTVVAMQQYARDVVKLLEDPTNPAAPVRQISYFGRFEGKNLNSPNDVVFAPDGSFFFSDPDYGLKQGAKDPAKQIPFQAVFRVLDGCPLPVITDLTTPNGVTLSPDSKTLYVNNSGPDMRTMRYDIRPDGSVSSGSVVFAYAFVAGCLRAPPSVRRGHPDITRSERRRRGSGGRVRCRCR